MRLPLLYAITLLNLALPAVAQESDGWAAIYPDGARPGTAAELVVTHSWADADTPAPGIAAPEWGALPGGVTASVKSIVAETTPSGTVSRMVIAFTAQEPGAYAIPALQVALLDEDLSPFQTEAFTFKVQAANAEQWLAAIAGVVVLAVGGFVYLRQRRRATGSATPSGQTRADQFAAKLHEARRYRLDGNFYYYYQALTDAAALCGKTSEEDLVGKLRERTRQVGYQGLRPSDDELDSVLREVERASRRVNEEQTV